MRKEPYTMEELFTKAASVLKEQGQWLDILDYFISDREAGSKTITIDEFDLFFIPQYGSSEGIYCDFYFDGRWDADESDYKRLEFATAKTLAETDDAFRDMALLGANFVLAVRKIMRTESDDFNWTGYLITAKNKQDKVVKRYVSSEREAIEKAESMLLDGASSITVRNNRTRELKNIG